MAKVKDEGAVQEQAGNPTTGTEGGKPEGEKKARGPVNKTFEFVSDPKEDIKLAPQAKLIVEEVKKAGKITRVDLCKALGANPNFKTRQPIERIVTYYQKDLEKAGVLKVAA